MNITSLLAASLLAQISALADIGPKPTIYIRWEQKSEMETKSIELLQCEDATCKNAAPLKVAGPQHFSCGGKAKEISCFGMAYGFAPYSQISAKINGKKLLSKPFISPSSEAAYVVKASGVSLELSPITALGENEKTKIRIDSAQ